jgi:hypothetical protein
VAFKISQCVGPKHEQQQKRIFGGVCVGLKHEQQQKRIFGGVCVGLKHEEQQKRIVCGISSRDIHGLRFNKKKTQ